MALLLTAAAGGCVQLAGITSSCCEPAPRPWNAGVLSRASSIPCVTASCLVSTTVPTQCTASPAPQGCSLPSGLPTCVRQRMVLSSCMGEQAEGRRAVGRTVVHRQLRSQLAVQEHAVPGAVVWLGCEGHPAAVDCKQSGHTARQWLIASNWGTLQTS